MHIQTDRARVAAGTPAVRFLHIVINAPSGTAKDDTRPPVSVAFVLDRSGSMDGQKIVMAREAVAHAIQLLKPKDNLAVVCYDEEITTVLERTSASAEAKRVALNRLADVQARGSTDLHGGWTHGAELVKPGQDSADNVSKVLLLTDGLANHGVIDHAQLLEESRRFRTAGVVTSTFGVGRDFDEDLLSRIATQGGGQFYFIERPAQIPDFLASELGETLEVVARDVELEIVRDPGVEVRTISDLPCEPGHDSVRIKIGDLVSDQEVSLVVAILFKGAQVEGTSLGVQCSLRDRHGVLPSLPMNVSWDAVDAASDRNQAVNGEVIYMVATVLAERARRDAIAANAAGKFDQARRIIQEALDDMRAYAQDDPRVLDLIDGLHRDTLELGEAMDAMARKARHFASYQALYSREAGGTARRKRRP